MLSKSIKKTLSLINIKNISKSFFNLNKKNHISALYKIQTRNFSEAKETEPINEEPELIQTNKENLGFKAETKKLLDIVTHSLYTDKEIFLRELLSNCSDALEKQRFMEVTGQLKMTGEPLFISISTNEKNKTITLFDSGIGMTRQEMIENLGTIAKSGTQNFLKNFKDSQNNSSESLIGQFGVGFYSSFIVGDTVEVISKPQDASKAYNWVSDGNGEFQISDVENPGFTRGTKVIIHLKSECRDFCRPTELIKIIKKYSNFISYTIKLNGEVVNNLQAIWYRDRKDVTVDEYQKFYELLANNTKLPYKYMLHFSSDVPLDIKALLYIPSSTMEKYGVSEENTGLSLYSKKILIKQKCTELLPNYFRFIKGVVDCSDIPLSISRESYQDSNLIFKLRVLITKRIIKKLEDEMKADPESYDKWFDDFQQYIREAVFSDHDNSESLIKLLRFKSTFSTYKKINLDDYTSKMKQGQDKIYFCVITTDSDIDSNVFLETFKGSDLPILICSNPLDEILFKNKGQFKNFKFINIENESDDFLDQHKQENSNSINRIPDEEVAPLTLWIKNELEPFVTKVSISKRLKDTPILVTSNISTHMKTMMAMMNPDLKDPYSSMKDFIVEINPSNDIIINLNRMRKEDPKLATLIIKNLYDTALLQSNIPIQNKDYTKRSFQIVKLLMTHKFSSPETIDPEIERLDEESLKKTKDDIKLSNSDIFSDFKLKDK